MKSVLPRPLTFRERLILYITIVLGILFILMRFLIIPGLKAVNSLNDEIDKKSNLLKKYSHLAKKAPAIISIYETIKDDIKAEVNLQEEANTFLTEIDKIADSSGLSVQGIKPLTSKKEKNHTKLYLEVSSRGDMRSTLQFICTLENSSLFVVIPSLKISPQRKNPNLLNSIVKIYKIVF